MQKKRLILSAGLLLAWLISTAYAFWWFQARDLRLFEPATATPVQALALQQSLQLLLTGKMIKSDSKLLFHFWQPGCLCNRFNRSHVNELAQKYNPHQFQLITVTQPHPGYSNEELRHLAEQEFDAPLLIDTDGLFSGPASIPAFPAAAVLDANGQLAYFGPYSDSTFCGINGNNFVEKVADAMLTNQHPSLMNTLVFGCFCDWHQSKSTRV